MMRCDPPDVLDNLQSLINWCGALDRWGVKWKHWERGVSKCNFGHHKSHIECSKSEPGSPPLEGV